MLLRFLVAAETGAHRGENFLGKGMLLARSEARVQGRGQHLGRHRLVDRGIHGPAAFAGILDKAGILIERCVLGQRRRGEIEQPGRDHAAAPPDLGDVGDIECETVILRQRVDISVLEDVETFGITCIRPYSMPLCTILTKCPAPTGPAWM